MTWPVIIWHPRYIKESQSLPRLLRATQTQESIQVLCLVSECCQFLSYSFRVICSWITCFIFSFGWMSQVLHRNWYRNVAAWGIISCEEGSPPELLVTHFLKSVNRYCLATVCFWHSYLLCFQIYLRTYLCLWASICSYLPMRTGKRLIFTSIHGHFNSGQAVLCHRRLLPWGNDPRRPHHTPQLLHWYWTYPHRHSCSRKLSHRP